MKNYFDLTQEEQIVIQKSDVRDLTYEQKLQYCEYYCREHANNYEECAEICTSLSKYLLCYKVINDFDDKTTRMENLTVETIANTLEALAVALTDLYNQY